MMEFINDFILHRVSFELAYFPFRTQHFDESYAQVVAKSSRPKKRTNKWAKEIEHVYFKSQQIKYF